MDWIFIILPLSLEILSSSPPFRLVLDWILSTSHPFFLEFFGIFIQLAIIFVGLGLDSFILPSISFIYSFQLATI